MKVRVMGYTLLKYGSPILRKKAELIDKVSGEIKSLAAEMFEIMRDAQGIGLAATQIGILKRLFVVDATKYLDEAAKPFAMANPVIKKRYGGWSLDKEGCLSIPGVEGNVKRVRKILIEGVDVEMGKVEFVATDLLARIIQHEVDHLDGILFIDRMGLIDRAKLRQKIKLIG